jgi:hypothetical protein
VVTQRSARNSYGSQHIVPKSETISIRQLAVVKSGHSSPDEALAFTHLVAKASARRPPEPSVSIEREEDSLLSQGLARAHLLFDYQYHRS